MSKPCKILRDLKPGDIGVCRDGVKAVYKGFGTPTWPHTFTREDWGQYTVNDNGYQFSAREQRCRDIIRIERITSKPKKAKVDRDAKWLMRLSGEGQTMDTDTMRRRLRAIARRLNGGKLP